MGSMWGDLPAPEPFPADCQGSGPMFAAIPAGDKGYNLALSGATTYTVENPSPDGPPLFGDSVILDKDLAEQVADAATGGHYVRWDGLTGREVTTPAHVEWSPGCTAYLSPPEAG